MCRFLIVKSEDPIDIKPLLKQFSTVAESSHTPDGDWQGDGGGIAWREGNRWKATKSLKPFWLQQLPSLPKTNIFLAHARSASFEKHKGILEYNQPYVSGNSAFVFNGMIRGVKLNRQVPGKIGAQKIFSLVQDEVSSGKSSSQALKKVHSLLQKSSRKLRGLNIGLSDGASITALCAYQEDSEYFTLNYHISKKFNVICSEPIGNYTYSKMKQGEIISL